MKVAHEVPSTENHQSPQIEEIPPVVDQSMKLETTKVVDGQKDDKVVTSSEPEKTIENKVKESSAMKLFDPKVRSQALKSSSMQKERPSCFMLTKLEVFFSNDCIIFCSKCVSVYECVPVGGWVGGWLGVCTNYYKHNL